MVDGLADELRGHANVVKANVEESPELAAQYGVQSIPTFIVVHDGKVKERLVGAPTRQALVTAVAA